MLDGFPRTTDQAEFLENVLWKLKKKLNFILNLVAPESIIVSRMTARRNCGKCGAVYNLVTIKPKKKDTCDKCGSTLVQRKDDEPETVRKRIQVYNQETSPLVDYYKKKKMLTEINASKKPKEIFADVAKIIDSLAQEPEK